MANNITTTSSSISNQPQWFQQALQQLVKQAQTTANQGYTPYPNSRIAGFTQPQQQAFNTVQGNVGSYRPGFNTAAQDYSFGNNPSLNKGVFNSYFNPYESQVVNQIQTLGNRNLMENVLPGVNATFTGAGQFGSSRNADFTNRALRDNQEAISQAQGQALASGFQNQVGNTQNAIGQAMQAGQLNQGLGLANQQAGLTDASALSAIGQQQQNLNQSNQNLAYQDFMTQQQWPYQQETYLSGILGGAPVPTQTQSSQTVPGPSTTSQVLGGLAGVTGLIGAAGGLGGIANTISGLFAEGGPVGIADGGTPSGGTGTSGWMTDLPNTPFKDGGTIRRLAAGGLPGMPMPKAPIPRMPAIHSRRPRLGGIATRRLGGIGMMPGGGTTGVLPGAPAGIAGRMPGAMNPGAASVMRGLSGMGTPAAITGARTI